MNEVKQTLVRAKALIADRRHWIKGLGHMHLDGDEYAYCAIGAVDKASDHSVRPEVMDALARAVPANVWHESGNMMRIVLFNDSPETTHADVIALFDRAIESVARP